MIIESVRERFSNIVLSSERSLLPRLILTQSREPLFSLNNKLCPESLLFLQDPINKINAVNMFIVLLHAYISFMRKDRHFQKTARTLATVHRKLTTEGKVCKYSRVSTKVFFFFFFFFQYKRREP